MNGIAKRYDKIASLWYSVKTPRIISWLLIGAFVTGFVLAELSRRNYGGLN